MNKQMERGPWIDLTDRVALVTGAAAGIGRACAIGLGAVGATVLVTDRDAQGAQAVAREIEADGGVAQAMGLDVTSDTDWLAIENWIRDGWGKLDIFVNNAGIFRADRVGDDTIEEYRRIFAVNVEGALLGMRTALRFMREAGRGSIINMSSAAALRAAPRTVSYGASKAALEHFSKSAALENAQMGHDIRINSIHPGMTETVMADDVYALYGDREALVPRMTTGRDAQPREIADLVTFLASDRSTYISGAMIVIDRAKSV